MNRIKFEHVFAFAILAILTIALFLFKNDKETSYLIIGTFVSGIGAITAYFFTKHNPNVPKK